MLDTAYWILVTHLASVKLLTFTGYFWQGSPCLASGFSVQVSVTRL